MPKTITKPAGAKLPASIRRLSHELKSRAVAAWRTWAQTIAAGGDCPPARDVVDTAILLKIDNPAARLQADADAIEEVAKYEAAAELCRRTVAEKLAEFGGQLPKLQAAMEAARADHQRLAAILDEVQAGCSEHFWTTAAHRTRAAHPLIWPEASPTRIERGDEDDDALEMEVQK